MTGQSHQAPDRERDRQRKRAARQRRKAARRAGQLALLADDQPAALTREQWQQAWKNDSPKEQEDAK
jgi:hypothetical protein